jgi:hypothetical protein
MLDYLGQCFDSVTSFAAQHESFQSYLSTHTCLGIVF